MMLSYAPRMPLSLTALIGIGSYVMGLYVVGCGQAALGRLPGRVNVVLDSTVASRLAAARSREARLISGLGRDASAGVFVLDRECVEVFSPQQPLPGGYDKALRMLLRRVPPSRGRGTFPHTAWTRLAEEARRDPRPTVIVWETDGDQDRPDEAAEQETRRAIGALAALSHVRLVVLVGISPGQRERVRREILPLGDRAVMLEHDARASDLSARVGGALHDAPRAGASTTALAGGGR